MTKAEAQAAASKRAGETATRCVFGEFTGGVKQIAGDWYAVMRDMATGYEVFAPLRP